MSELGSTRHQSGGASRATLRHTVKRSSTARREAYFLDFARDIVAVAAMPVLFGLPLPQTTGMVASILSLAKLDWPVPDFSTLSRRQKTIAVQITQRRAPGPLNLLVESTGIKFLGVRRNRGCSAAA